MLELRNAGYAYPGEIKALRDIDLRIPAGQRLAILGPNGAGKTTLLTLLNATIRPDQGAIFLDDRPLSYDKRGLTALRQQVGLVLQDPDDQLFAASVFEDVSFGPLNLGLEQAEATKRVADTLRLMKIEELAERPTHMLSFGQRKRVAIAGILAMQPRYLLLDEPTAGLDPLGVTQLMEALDDVIRLGTAIVLTTHDVDMAYAWADRMVVFESGHIASQGTPEQVFSTADLASLRLRAPLIWEIAEALRRLGLIAPGGVLPRSRSDLLTLLGDRQPS
jgi:cobalt/nickel transport system ATP-binding protein